MALTAPTVTGYSPFWSLTGDRAAYSMVLAQGRLKNAKLISKRIRTMGGRDAIGALAALIGAAAGGTATNTWARVKHPGANQTVPLPTGITDFSGNRVIETVTAISRATTAADVTELKKWFTTALLEAGVTYPTVLGSGVAAGTMHTGSPGFS